MVEDIVVVARYHTLLEAEIAKSILSCAGIPATIESDDTTSLYKYGNKVRIVVAAEDSEQARIILRIRE